MDRNEIISAAVTAVIIGLLACFLIIFGMEASVPDSEEGLTVNFGNVDLSSGMFEPYADQESQHSTPEPSTPPVTAQTPAQDELITQEDESVDLLAQARQRAEQDARRLEEERRQEELRRQAEEERLRQEQERRAAETQQLAKNLFGQSQGSQSQDQGQGDTPQGNQGQTQGHPESQHYEGAGAGYGNFSLDGRGLVGSLPRPQNNARNAEGVVVVRIGVNNDGQVVSSQIHIGTVPGGGASTNTENVQLRQAAMQAARQARFNAIKGSGDMQYGYITYFFTLR